MKEQTYKDLLEVIWDNHAEIDMQKDYFYDICLPVIKQAWCDGYRAGNDDAFES